MDPANDKKPRSSVGQAVHVMGDAIELVEELCEASLGEVTPEVSAAETWADLKTAEAFEALARFERWCRHGMDAVKVENERLAEAERRIKSRLTWCQDQIREALEREGKKSWSAGPFRITSTAGRWRCEAEGGLGQKEIEAMPESCREWVDPVEGKWRVDKKGAEKELANGFPVAGLRRVKGKRSIKVT